MSEAIQKGDLVRLKSNGLTMVVDRIDQGGAGTDGEMRVWCCWFDGEDQLREKDFAVTSVRRLKRGEA